MGIPLYRSPSARRREVEQAAAQQNDPRRTRSGAPVPPLRREDAQRLSSQTPSTAGTGTQERPIDLTRLSIGSEEDHRRGPTSSPETPIQSTEDGMEDGDNAASAAMSNYSRTQFDSSELDTPAEEGELRLPDYGTPDVDWSTPEMDAASTPPRAARSSPRPVRSSPPALHFAPQPQRHQYQAAPAPSPAPAGLQQPQASGGFVHVVVDETRGPVVQVSGSPGQAIPPSRRLPGLPPLPRPADATIRGLRRNRQGQSSMSTASPNTSGYESGSSVNPSSDSSSRRRPGN